MGMTKQQPLKNGQFTDSLRHAIQGLKQALHTERNMRYHLVATVAVCAVAAWLRGTSSEWLWVLLSCALVWVCELFNTAIEAVVDLVVGTERHPLAKKAKDCAAAATFVAAVFALCVAACVLLPKLL